MIPRTLLDGVVPGPLWLWQPCSNQGSTCTCWEAGGHESSTACGERLLLYTLIWGKLSPRLFSRIQKPEIERKSPNIVNFLGIHTLDLMIQQLSPSTVQDRGCNSTLHHSAVLTSRWFEHGGTLTSMIRYSTGRGRASWVISLPNLSIS